MCIIIDANKGSEITVLSDDARPVMNSIMFGDLKIVVGHQLKTELLNCSFRRIYSQLQKAGKLIEYFADAIDSEIKKLDKTAVRSNDAHIIALARISGARLLFSADRSLHRDFKNSQLVNNPRGRIYQNKGHRNLLAEPGICLCG